jgi:hypothetical protein
MLAVVRIFGVGRAIAGDHNIALILLLWLVIRYLGYRWSLRHFLESIIVRSDICMLYTLDLALLENLRENKKYRIFKGGVGQELVKVGRRQFHAFFAHGVGVDALAYRHTGGSIDPMHFVILD